jgi:predicted dinucleotide-binding enzyme
VEVRDGRAPTALRGNGVTHFIVSDDVERSRRFYTGEEVERLIRAAGFEPVKAGGTGQSGRLEVGGDLHDLVVGPAQARSLTGGT